jgi:hypothetical protein
MPDTQRHHGRRALLVTAALLAVAAAIALARPVAFVCGWEDPTEGNQQLVAVSRQLSGSLTRDRFLAVARDYPLLTVRTNASTDGRWLVLRTPRRFAANNWVAWLEFDDKKDVPVRAYFGTVDYVGTDDEGKATGMPRNVCFGTPSECSGPLF